MIRTKFRGLNHSHLSNDCSDIFRDNRRSAKLIRIKLV